ncbi:hypothetical protein F4818DRAFT_434836 [Hypoxylon cercidicola]|nr:hypothetical protein F4818DRAFT_434836 [Hypoxylon cercidicola]
MPSRRFPPTLSIFKRNSASASSTSPPSTQSSSLPVTPPARLHLRNILPVCPDGMPTPPPPPRVPYPWLWQCHMCSTVYQIGCTRRCLLCSHEYCVSTNPPKRGTKRRRPSGSCASEFDYSGWADWGAWRRKVVGLEVAGHSGKMQREQAFAMRTHNCMMDCDYPSECHHERYRLHTEALEKKLLQAVSEVPRSPSIVASVPLSPDDELPLNEAIKVREYEGEGDELKSPTSPKSPLSQTSFFFFDDSDEVDVADQKEEESKVDNEGRKKRKTKSSKNQQPIGEQDEAGYSAGINKDTVEDTLQRLIDEDENMMPLELLEANVMTRCQSRMSNREHPKHPKHSGKLTVRNLTEADKENDWDESSDSDSDSSLSLSLTSSCSDGEWLSASELTCVSEDGIQAGEGNEEESDEELDALVAAGKSFLRE